MIVLVYKIILAVISLTNLVGDKAKEPDFKRHILELVVYPIVLLGILAWIVYLVTVSQTHFMDFPTVVGIIVAQEVTIDVIVTRVSKKVDSVSSESEDKTDI